MSPQTSTKEKLPTVHEDSNEVFQSTNIPADYAQPNLGLKMLARLTTARSGYMLVGSTSALGITHPH